MWGKHEEWWGRRSLGERKNCEVEQEITGELEKCGTKLWETQAFVEDNGELWDRKMNWRECGIVG